MDLLQDLPSIKSDSAVRLLCRVSTKPRVALQVTIGNGRVPECPRVSHLVDVNLVALHSLLGPLRPPGAGLLGNSLLGRLGGFLLCLGGHDCLRQVGAKGSKAADEQSLMSGACESARQEFIVAPTETRAVRSSFGRFGQLWVCCALDESKQAVTSKSLAVCVHRHHSPHF